MNEKKILGIPKEVTEKTFQIFRKIGIDVPAVDREYEVPTNGTKIFNTIIRLKSAALIEELRLGNIKAAIVGWDWLCEKNAQDEFIKIVELDYAKKTNEPVRIVIAARNTITEIKDEPTTIVVAEYENLARQQFKHARIIPSNGTTEGRLLLGPLYPPRYGVFVAEKGVTLRQNNLRVLKTILISPMFLVAEKRMPELENFGLALKNALDSDKF